MHRRITILDDDCALARSLEILLSSRGHDVTCVADPASACEVIVEHPPEVLVLDYAMPGMNGDEVLRRLRKRLPATCHVIVVTGHIEELRKRDIERLGAHDLLPKPLSFDRLCGLVEGRWGPECEGERADG